VIVTSCLGWLGSQLWLLPARPIIHGKARLLGGIIGDRGRPRAPEELLVRGGGVGGRLFAARTMPTHGPPSHGISHTWNSSVALLLEACQPTSDVASARPLGFASLRVMREGGKEAKGEQRKAKKQKNGVPGR
jgi:hypothetical protein